MDAFYNWIILPQWHDLTRILFVGHVSERKRCFIQKKLLSNLQFPQSKAVNSITPAPVNGKNMKTAEMKNSSQQKYFHWNILLKSNKFHQSSKEIAKEIFHFKKNSNPARASRNSRVLVFARIAQDGERNSKRKKLLRNYIISDLIPLHFQLQPQHSTNWDKVEGENDYHLHC